MRTRPERPVLLLTAIALTVLLPSLAHSQPMAPVADPKAIVTSGEARFTVLTSRLIRMEWSDTRQFEDRASLVFINRRQPVPAFKTQTRSGWLTISTDALTLRYKTGTGKFTAANLDVQITLSGKPVVWKPGMEDTGNLRGTTRTLDGVNGPAQIEPGLVSRDGWVVVDDTGRLLYDNSDWPWVTSRATGTRQDWYFFGYGHDYRGALGDFTKAAGRIPMPPRFAFGVWWSRYWAYTDEEFKRLVGEFEDHSLPLDVLVIDMDWHQTFGGAWVNPKDQSGHTKGWTGFTWDRNYFPNPESFLTWTDQHGLRTPLNLHPASGIQPWEEQYPAMARAMGIDPSTQQYVPFDIVDKKFAASFFNLVIHPLEKQGVDFWWLDWQQSDKTKLEGINPTWWLNYTFFTDMERQGKHRPLIFHRWGGLGNHRYQVGFSGDTYSTWESLGFQPYFTATAANVGFGYWSHDIGGHMNGPVAPELYTRWIQFGAFSPILRTHTTKNPDAERRVWAFPPEYAGAMSEAFRLRYSLVPYLYTASRQTYDTGVPFFRPVYYDFPEAAEAYTAKDEYLFGDSFLVSPVVSERAKDTGLASKTTWLPEGLWIERSTGRVFQGPATIQRRFGLNEIPIYVKAGSIIPMQQPDRRAGALPLDRLILTVYPGASGSTRVYEDQGDSVAYQSNECAWLPVTLNTEADGTRVVAIKPVEGKYPAMPAERTIELKVKSGLPFKSIRIAGAGRDVTWMGEFQPDSQRRDVFAVGFDGETGTSTIVVPRVKPSDSLEIRITPAPVPAPLASLVDGWAGVQARLHDLHDLVNRGWSKAVPSDILINLVQSGNRMSLNPSSAQDEFVALSKGLPILAQEIAKLQLTPEARSRADALLAEMQLR